MTAPKRRPPTGVLIGAIVIVLILIGGGSLLLTKGSSPSSSANPGATSIESAGASSTVDPGPTFAVSPSAGLAPTPPAPSDGAPGQSSKPTSAAPTQAPTSSDPPATPKPTPRPTPKPTLEPTLQPTASPTPTTAPVIKFNVSPQVVAGNCKQGLANFPLSLDNAGSNVPVTWSIVFSASPVQGDWGTAQPASGVVQAGKAAGLTIEPNKLCSGLQAPTDFVLKVLYGDGQTIAVTFSVTP